MILETLLKDVTWDAKGITCSDEATGHKLYDFLYELILDSHLYVTKPIGFYIDSKSYNSKAGTYIARNSQIGESYPELMTNLQDKVILECTQPVIKAEMQKGRVTTDVFKEKILCMHNYVCRVLDGSCQLILKLSTDCGYKTLKDTSKQLDPKFFPMNTYFNINDYVRIIPAVESFKRIELRYYHGMTHEILFGMLRRYQDMVNSLNVSEEERQWALSFTL